MANKWTVPQLANKAGISQTYIKRLLATHKIPGYKLGRDWVIEDKDALAWLAGREAIKRGRPRKQNLKRG